MPSLSSLANIPGYGAYIAKKQMNEQQGLQDLQQASALLNIRNAIQQQRQEQQFNQSLSEAGGDVEAMMNAALRAGRPDVAAKLSTIAEARRRAKEGRVLNPGQVVLGENNEVKFSVPFKQEVPSEPPDVRMVNFYNSLPDNDPRKAVLKQIIDAKTRAPQERTSFPIVTTGDGIFERRPEGLVQLRDPKTGQPLKPTARERPITEYQGKNALYGTRAAMAHKTLNDLEEKISLSGLATKQALQNTPVIGGLLGAGGNVLLSKEQQAVEQAQRNFVNAVLRQESGAVISEQEFENAKKQYFPQPGDKKEVIEQKRRNRMAAIEGFKRIAGPAWSGEEQVTPQTPADILKKADEILGR